MYATTIESACDDASDVLKCAGPSKPCGVDDADLIARAQAGEESAFREIVDRYGTRICRVSYGILRNRDDADEAAQEVFAKVYCSIRSFRGGCSLYVWIYRIAINVCYGSLRKHRLKVVHSSDSSEGSLGLRVDGIADVHPTHDQITLQRDLINKLLLRIPEGDRWLLLSKEVEGFSIAELAEMTGMNENTIKVRLFRIRQQLVTAMARLRSRHRPVS